MGARRVGSLAALLLAACARGANEGEAYEETLFFSFELYGSDNTCTGKDYGLKQSSYEHRHVLSYPYLVYDYTDGDSDLRGQDLAEVSNQDGSTAITPQFGVAMPDVIGRCFKSAKLKMRHPGYEYFSFGCDTGSGSEIMFMHGFQNLTHCRNAFYCSNSNPEQIMKGEAPIMVGGDQEKRANCDRLLGPESGTQLLINANTASYSKAVYDDADWTVYTSGNKYGVGLQNPPYDPVGKGANCKERCVCDRWPDLTPHPEYRIYKGCTAPSKLPTGATLDIYWNWPDIKKFDPRTSGLTLLSRGGIAIGAVASVLFLGSLALIIAWPKIQAKRGRKLAGDVPPSAVDDQPEPIRAGDAGSADDVARRLSVPMAQSRIPSLSDRKASAMALPHRAPPQAAGLSGGLVEIGGVGIISSNRSSFCGTGFGGSPLQYVHGSYDRSRTHSLPPVLQSPPFGGPPHQGARSQSVALQPIRRPSHVADGPGGSTGYDASRLPFAPPRPP